MVKILFLDIDGVLNTNIWDENNKSEEQALVEESKVKILKEIIKATGAKIVLHSGWKYWFDDSLNPLREEAEYLIKMLNKYEMDLSGKTPDLATDEIKASRKFSLVKAEEILQYISSYDEEISYIVLDDLDLHNSIIFQHQIQTEPEIGLQREHILQAIEMLQWRKNTI